MLHFERSWNSRSDRIAVQPDNLVVAGWTGRDMAAVQHHIDELAAIGVPAPSTVPLFYRLAVTQLTQASVLQVLGPDTSGEVEPVVFALADGLWIGLGSDHTDRKAEAMGVALSKQLCAKVVGTGLWRAFGGLEKGSAFYLGSRLFLLKMALFVAVLALEIWPMVTLMGWRRARRRGEAVDTGRARALFHVNHAQLAIVVLMVFVASAMARGLW